MRRVYQLSIDNCCKRPHSAANRPQTAMLLLIDGTDRPTDTPTLYRPCSAFYAGSVNSALRFLGPKQMSKLSTATIICRRSFRRGNGHFRRFRFGDELVIIPVYTNLRFTDYDILALHHRNISQDAWWRTSRASDLRPRGRRFDPGRGAAA